MYSYGFQAHKSSKYIKSPRTSIAIAMLFRSFRAPYNSNDKWMWLMVVPQRNWKIKHKKTKLNKHRQGKKNNHSAFTLIYFCICSFGYSESTASEFVCVRAVAMHPNQYMFRALCEFCMNLLHHTHTPTQPSTSQFPISLNLLICRSIDKMDYAWICSILNCRSIMDCENVMFHSEICSRSPIVYNVN